jgi:hypothetical protein
VCLSTGPERENLMPRYRVTLRRSSVEIVEASNQFQAAIVARDMFGDSVEIADVAPAVGRPPVSAGGGRKAPAKKAAKKRRQLSPEARAKLAQNLVKARAARAAKAKAAKKSSKSTAKKASKRVAKKR